MSQQAKWEKEEPPLEAIRYTPVLTKQSALFNAWKILCEISDSKGIPIRLTPYALAQEAKGQETKKDNKKKKVESMMLVSCWESSTV